LSETQTEFSGSRICCSQLGFEMASKRLSMVVGRVVLGAARVLKPLIPKRIAAAAEDRFFGAVFHLTRVTNDNYGNGTQETPADPTKNR
jgi:hypothetical protein